MIDALFPGYAMRSVAIGAQQICVHVGGTGPALLLLHGYPQNHAAWIKLAAPLASRFTCVIADLPGYGGSSVPSDTPGHDSFSKRRMAALLVATMASLGHTAFSVMGHDRGARVAYRMALDHPASIRSLVIVEIIPTSAMWDAFDAGMAMKAYHWSFLAQPYPLPETLIASDPVFYLDWTLRSWTKAKSLDAFDPRALESYRRQISDPARVHAMCEDYRAGASIDRTIDREDQARGARIAAPLHFIWSKSGFPASSGRPLQLWEGWTDRLTGREIDCGHFAPEENPDDLLTAVLPFLTANS
jgi:haloacetate dehalogenase